MFKRKNSEDDGAQPPKSQKLEQPEIPSIAPINAIHDMISRVRRHETDALSMTSAAFEDILYSDRFKTIFSSWKTTYTQTRIPGKSHITIEVDSQEWFDYLYKHEYRGRGHSRFLTPGSIARQTHDALEKMISVDSSCRARFPALFSNTNDKKRRCYDSSYVNTGNFEHMLTIHYPFTRNLFDYLDVRDLVNLVSQFPDNGLLSNLALERAGRKRFKVDLYFQLEEFTCASVSTISNGGIFAVVKELHMPACAYKAIKMIRYSREQALELARGSSAVNHIWDFHAFGSAAHPLGQYATDKKICDRLNSLYHRGAFFIVQASVDLYKNKHECLKTHLINTYHMDTSTDVYHIGNGHAEAANDKIPFLNPQNAEFTRFSSLDRGNWEPSEKITDCFSDEKSLDTLLNGPRIHYRFMTPDMTRHLREPPQHVVSVTSYWYANNYGSLAALFELFARTQYSFSEYFSRTKKTMAEEYPEIPSPDLSENLVWYREQLTSIPSYMALPLLFEQFENQSYTGLLCKTLEPQNDNVVCSLISTASDLVQSTWLAV